MTPGEMQQLLNEAQLAGTLQELYSDQNRVRVLPSANEVERAEEAVGWPAIYLADDRDMAMILTGWVDGLIRRPNGDAEMPRLVTHGLKLIDEGLDPDRIPVK